jgi:hypothetical protein
MLASRKQFDKMKNTSYIQRVTEISTLILTGNRTRQKEQLFYLPFCRKTMFNSKKKLERFFIYNIPRDRYIAGNFFEQSSHTSVCSKKIARGR